MFDKDLIGEKRLIRKSHLDAVVHFLRGDPIRENQRTLGFWAFDFKWIPVETISAIYEDFLEKEDSQAKRKSGTYYTPRFLAELVIDIATENVHELSDKRFLDPACGSGIFLVLLFNRLAAVWLHEHPSAQYRTRARALNRIMREQLRGVDRSEIACRIACFSLYLTFLDHFDPPDIRAYIEKTGERLPNILTFGDGREHELDFPVIHNDDFLDPKRDLPKDVNFVVGNPPWSGRGTKQIALRFMNRARDVLHPNGTGSLLLPSKAFLNRTDAFQSKWLTSVKLEKVVQLADFRFILFKNALCPCMIVRFKSEPRALADHTIEYEVPKVSKADFRQGVVIPIAPNDRKIIPLRRILEAAKVGLAPVVWKKHLWGTPRDAKFLDFLMELPKLGDLADSPHQNRRWSKDPRGKPRGIFSTIPAPTALYAIACNLPPHRDSRYTPRSRSRCCVAPPCLRSNLFPRTLRPTIAPSPPVLSQTLRAQLHSSPS